MFPPHIEFERRSFHERQRMTFVMVCRANGVNAAGSLHSPARNTINTDRNPICHTHPHRRSAGCFALANSDAHV